MEKWNNYKIKHHGINFNDDIPTLRTTVHDENTKYIVVEIITQVLYNAIEYHIGTNEGMLKRLNLPFYKHCAEPSYMEGKKYFGKKNRTSKKIKCLSVGIANVRIISKAIITYWKDHGYKIKRISITGRETGNIRDKGEYRSLELRT